MGDAWSRLEYPLGHSPLCYDLQENFDEYGKFRNIFYERIRAITAVAGWRIAVARGANVKDCTRVSAASRRFEKRMGGGKIVGKDFFYPFVPFRNLSKKAVRTNVAC